MTTTRPTPQCPIRAGAPCSLCVPGATGPQDCGLVYLVMSDPELMTQRTGSRRAARELAATPQRVSITA